MEGVCADGMVATEAHPEESLSLRALSSFRLTFRAKGFFLLP